jgi:hypothetical protein
MYCIYNILCSAENCGFLKLEVVKYFNKLKCHLVFHCLAPDVAKRTAWDILCVNIYIYVCGGVCVCVYIRTYICIYKIINSFVKRNLHHCIYSLHLWHTKILSDKRKVVSNS